MKHIPHNELKENVHYLCFNKTTHHKEIAFLQYMGKDSETHFMFKINESLCFGARGYGRNVAYSEKIVSVKKGSIRVKRTEFFELAIDELIHFI